MNDGNTRNLGISPPASEVWRVASERRRREDMKWEVNEGLKKGTYKGGENFGCFEPQLQSLTGHTFFANLLA